MRRTPLIVSGPPTDRAELPRATRPVIWPLSSLAKARYVSLSEPTCSWQIYAFEKSPGRFMTLNQMLKKAACEHVISRRADFLQSDPNDPDFKSVTRL